MNTSNMPHQTHVIVSALLCFLCALFVHGQEAERSLNQPPEGFHALFNGKNLEGWWGIHHEFADVHVPFLRQAEKTKAAVDRPGSTALAHGTTILHKDISTIEEFMDKDSKYKGRQRTSGHFGFAGHNDPVSDRHIRIKSLR